MPELDLTQLQVGETGKVVEIMGGIGLIKKLAVMGVTIGTHVKKISAQFMGGPVTIQVGNTQLTIGFGMAKKIIVEQEK